MRTLILSLFFFLTGAVVANAQSILILDQPHKVHKVRYLEKDPIAFRLNHKKDVYTGQLDKIKDSTIMVNNREYKINEITQLIDLNKRFGVRILSKMSILFGVVFFSLNTFNNLINSQTPVLSKEALEVTLGTIAGGFLLRPFYYKTYTVNEHQSLKILKD